jgi:hypothetical protein
MAEKAPEIALATGMPFCLGQDGTSARKNGFSGDIDEFALWTRSLSHDEVRRIYEAGRKGIELGELLEKSIPPQTGLTEKSPDSVPARVER